jgi:uncharacterized BrkB/YihY/UPF0761 family membrane protein
VVAGRDAGAVFAVLSSVVISFYFSLYLCFVSSYIATYGSIGAVIVLMLGLYLLGLALFICCVINGEIEGMADPPSAGKQPRHRRSAARRGPSAHATPPI